MICLVQLLYSEAWPKRPVLLCQDCPFFDRCRDAAKDEGAGQAPPAAKKQLLRATGGAEGSEHIKKY